MSSLLSTLSMLPSHLTLEMSIALCVGMEMRAAIAEASINLFSGTLASTFLGEFTSEGLQYSRNGRPDYLACSKVGNLLPGWSIIDRKHDIPRSIRSRFDLNLT